MLSYLKLAVHSDCMGLIIISRPRACHDLNGPTAALIANTFVSGNKTDA